MNLVLVREKYAVSCDMNCGSKAEFSIKDENNNFYMHICSNCAESVEKCLKNRKKMIKKV